MFCASVTTFCASAKGYEKLLKNEGIPNNAQNNAHGQKMSPMDTQKPRNIGLFEWCG